MYARRRLSRRLTWNLIAVAASLLLGLTAATALVAADNLRNPQGNPVLTGSKVYITYWGVDWQNGFATNGYSSAQYQAYLETFIADIGDGDWIGTQTQYGASGPTLLFAGAWGRHLRGARHA